MKDEELQRIIDDVKETFGIHPNDNDFNRSAAIATLEHVYKVRAQNAQFRQVGELAGQVMDLFMKLKDVGNQQSQPATTVPPTALAPTSPANISNIVIQPLTVSVPGAQVDPTDQLPEPEPAKPEEQVTFTDVTDEAPEKKEEP